MRARFFIAVLPLGLCLAGAAFATPATPVINEPVNGSTIYNTRPWIRFYATDGSGHTINHILVRVGAWGNCHTGIVYDIDSNSYRLTFYPLAAASGAVITHRLVSALAPGAYQLCVYAYCDQAAGAPAWAVGKNFTVATPSWTDGPTVTAASTKIRAAHFNELHTAIDNVRVYHGLAGYSWTNGATFTTAVQARGVHMTDMRTALCAAYAAATGSACSLTFSDTPNTSTKVRAVHINELRSYVPLP